jgi:hypothetical protein
MPAICEIWHLTGFIFGLFSGLALGAFLGVGITAAIMTKDE